MDLKTYLALEAKAEKQCSEAWDAMSLARQDARQEDGNEENAIGYLVNKLASQATTERAEKWLIAEGIRF